MENPKNKKWLDFVLKQNNIQKNKNWINVLLLPARNTYNRIIALCKDENRNFLTFLLSPITTIYKQEQIHALIAFFAYFLLMASYYMIRPTRSSLFLKEWGWEAMPIFYLIIAVFTLITTFGYNFFVGICSRAKLIRIVFSTTILSFIAFWLLYKLGYYPREVTIFWYIWVCIYILFLTALFWSLNHDLHTAEQSRRLYPLLLLGAQAGVYFGSNMTQILLKKWEIGNYNLIILSSLLLLGVWILLEILSFRQTSRQTTSLDTPQNTQSFKGLLKLLKNPYPLSIAAIVVIGTFAFTICDLQYKRLLSYEIQAPCEYTLKDFSDIEGILKKIQSPQNNIMSSLHKNLSQNFRLKLENHQPHLPMDVLFQEALVKEINALLHSLDLYKEENLKDIKISREIQKKLKETQEKPRWNRLILDSILAGEIHKKRTLIEKDANEQTAFLADNDKIMALCNIIMLFIIAPRLLRWLGPGWTVLFYPLATIAATFAFFYGVKIQTAAYFAIALSVLHYTLYLVGKEAFYVPTDKDTKYKIKAIIDTFGYRLGDALGGGVSTLYLIFLSMIGSNFVAGLGFFIFLAGFVWIPATLYSDKEYKRLTKQNNKE